MCVVVLPGTGEKASMMFSGPLAEEIGGRRMASGQKLSDLIKIKSATHKPTRPRQPPIAKKKRKFLAALDTTGEKVYTLFLFQNCTYFTRTFLKIYL